MFGAWMGLVVLAAGLAAARRSGAAGARLDGLAGSIERGAPGVLDQSLARLHGSRFVDVRLLHRRLVLAGREGEMPSHLRAKAWWAAAGLAAGFVLGGGGLTGGALGGVLAAAGWRMPDVRLARLGRRRQGEIARGVADLCEILAACAASGLGPAHALELSASGLRGPLADEVRRALGLLGVGARWGEVLEWLAERTEVPALRRLRAGLLQTERLGSSLETELRELAREERADRRAAAEARARAAPVKLLFPLALLILPAFLLLTVVPVVLATLRSLG
ncbi:MAG: type II secretion system F family protein [Actinomycetota bacterium]